MFLDLIIYLIQWEKEAPSFKLTSKQKFILGWEFKYLNIFFTWQVIFSPRTDKRPLNRDQQTENSANQMTDKELKYELHIKF